MFAATIFQSLRYLEFYPHLSNAGNPQLPNPVLPDQAVLPQVGLEREAEFLVQKQRLLTKGLKPNPGAAECFPTPPLTTTLLKSCLPQLLPGTSCSAITRKLQGITQSKTTL